MGYGKKGWFKTYIDMIGYSFEYSRGLATNQKWIIRFFAQLFSVIWHIFVISVFIILPIFIIVWSFLFFL